MSHNDQVSTYITDLTFNDVDDEEEAKQKMRLDIINSGSNRSTIYKKINPNLSAYEI